MATVADDMQPGPPNPQGPGPDDLDPEATNPVGVGPEAPPQADPLPLRRARRRALRKQTEHRRRRRLIVGLLSVLSALLLISVSVFGYFWWRYDQVPKVTLGGLRDPGERAGAADIASGAPMNVLVVGSDNRAVLSANEEDNFGSVEDTGAPRTDTLMVLRVDPGAERASILSIPRDLYVPIAGTDERARVNTAFEGGADRLVQTVRDALGIPIDHYVEVDFNGFRNIVRAVDGVPVYIDEAPVRDRKTGLDIGTAGCVTLDGEQALAYVRSREFQVRRDGRWVSDERSDFGRIERQQDFIRRVMAEAIKKGARNPATLNRIIGSTVDDVTIDEGLSAKDIFDLGRRFRTLEPSAIESITLPVEAFTGPGGAYYLRLVQPEAQVIIDRFNGVTRPPATAVPPNVSPAQVQVRVLNGTGERGQAASVAADLREAGFTVRGTGDAPDETYPETVVEHPPGMQDQAQLVRAWLGGRARLQEAPVASGQVQSSSTSTLRSTTTSSVTSGQPGEVQLITGLDFTEVRNPVQPVATVPPPGATEAQPGTTTTQPVGRPVDRQC